MELLVVQTLNALLYSSILFLIAAGLTLIYGVMRVVNLAHGSFYAIGAYMASWAIGLATAAGFSIPTQILLLLSGAVVVALLGIVVEPTLFRPLYHRAEEYQLLITFGLLLILEDSMRLFWGPAPLTVSELPNAFGNIPVLDGSYPGYNVFVIAIGAVVAVALWALVYRTDFGVLLRATSQDRRMASALGIDVRRVYLLAFATGCFMAGLGGAVVAPISGAVLGMGVDALVLAFVVVVIGGLGSLEGALAGALIVGALRTLGITYFAEIELAVLYLIAAAVLFVRPAGLLGRP